MIIVTDSNDSNNNNNNHPCGIKGGFTCENFKKTDGRGDLKAHYYQYGKTFALTNRIFNLMKITNDIGS